MQNFRSLTATILATIVLFGTINIATATPVPLVARDDTSQTLTMRQVEVEPQSNIASRDFSSLLPGLEESIVEFEARDDYIPHSSKVAQPLRRRNPTGGHEPESTPDYELPVDRPYTTELHQHAVDAINLAIKNIADMDLAKEKKDWGLVLMFVRCRLLRRMTPKEYVHHREDHRKERDRAAEMKTEYDKILTEFEKEEIDETVQFYDIVDKKYYNPEDPSVPLHLRFRPLNSFVS